MTQTARVALEWWRASGERTKERLRNLVAHYAETNGEMANLTFHMEVAMADIKHWELR
jgi:hypothetical protein